MLENNKEEKRLCLFFASDYHFEMISLPYINKSLKKNDNVIIITENNLEDTVNKVLENVNLTEEDKRKIMNIDWKNNDVNIIKEINYKENRKKHTIIFVKGKKDYINCINENIKDKYKEYTNIEIIDCYDINEIQEDSKNIAKNYNKFLATSGIIEN